MRQSETGFRLIRAVWAGYGMFIIILNSTAILDTGNYVYNQVRAARVNPGWSAVPEHRHTIFKFVWCF
jgi:hypothetical protein